MRIFQGLKSNKIAKVAHGKLTVAKSKLKAISRMEAYTYRSINRQK